MSDTDVILKVEGLSKTYFSELQSKRSIKDLFSDPFRKNNRPASRIEALKDVSFELKKGESLGIIGSNGAGKSTLLKILSGITSPTSGKVTINGRVLSVLDIGTGFHPDLTGRENVYLNGEILGMSRAEIDRKYEEIVAFSGIGEFINRPVKHYSSGMYLRLAFSIVVNMDADLLLFDEVIGVGDVTFRKQCSERINTLIYEQHKAVVLISHNIWEITGVQRVFYMEKGMLDTVSDKNDIIQRYFKQSDQYDLWTSRPLYVDKSKFRPKNELLGSLSTYIKNLEGAETSLFTNDQSVRVEINLHDIYENFNIGICLRDEHGNSILEISHILGGKELIPDQKNQQLSFSFPSWYFNAGYFILDVAIFNTEHILHYEKSAAEFQIKMEPSFQQTVFGHSFGFVKPYLEWQIIPV